MSRSPLLALILLLCIACGASAQLLPASGSNGLDVFWVTSSSGMSSQLYAVSLLLSPVPVPIGAPVPAVPSRWSHRRRYLGALETEIAVGGPLTLFTPMGSGVGSGAVHMFDARAGLSSTMAAVTNPPSYDLLVDEALQLVFAACDDGAGNTVLHGFSYATPSALTPLLPATLTIPGKPAGNLCRMGLDAAAHHLHVPTTLGIQVVDVSVGGMTPTTFVMTGAAAPVTSPVSFEHGGTTTWISGTSTFAAGSGPTAAGWVAWTASGPVGTGTFGIIPGLFPQRFYVLAAGAQELAVVSDGTRAYAHMLLRDPSPTALFIRPSAVGVIAFPPSGAPLTGTLVCSEACGEPFAIPTAHGTRVALESSQGPPFSNTPPDGSERISIVYTPLDPLGATSTFGILQTAGPLGGRISTKGMDRPIWSRDGKKVISSTSSFPGAPQPGIAGLEILDVPSDVMINEFVGPHTVVPNEPFPNQSIVFPSIFDPRDPNAVPFIGNATFTGGVFHAGLANALLLPFGEIGGFDAVSPIFVQSPLVPGFPGLIPAFLDDPGVPTVPLPGNFGPRRTSFNLYPGFGIAGIVHSLILDDRVFVVPAGFNALAAVGAVPAAAAPIVLTLPAGSIVTSEILSL